MIYFFLKRQIWEAKD